VLIKPQGESDRIEEEEEEEEKWGKKREIFFPQFLTCNSWFLKNISQLLSYPEFGEFFKK
jgi:hypothetical protein